MSHLVASWPSSPSQENEATHRRRAELRRLSRASKAATRTFLENREREIELQLAQCELPYQRKILTEILAALKSDSLHT